MNRCLLLAGEQADFTFSGQQDAYAADADDLLQYCVKYIYLVYIVHLTKLPNSSNHTQHNFYLQRMKSVSMWAVFFHS